MKPAEIRLFKNPPRTPEQLKADGLEYSGPGTCKHCQAEIEWWNRKVGLCTKAVPLDKDGSDHRRNCRGGPEEIDALIKKRRPWPEQR
jgi:hypothetical protein